MTALVSIRPGLALKFAARELRGGVRGFGVFLACLALGVAAIAGVGSVSRDLSDALARQGGVILGGDVALSLIHREASAGEMDFMEERGRVGVVSTMRAMARAGDNAATLVELKAVDASYPLSGEIVLDPPKGLVSLLGAPVGAYGAIADPTLLARLGIAIGDRIKIGDATFEITGTIASEPDKLAQGIGFGPRLIVASGALRASNLLQPGSLVRWTYRVKLDDASAQGLREFVSEARQRFPDAGWEIRTRTDASPQLERNVRRFSEFLTLVGLTALLVGGVGVANAVKYYLDRKSATIATFKAVGATGETVFSIYLAEVGLLALAGIGLGLLAGAALPFAISYGFGNLLPLPFIPSMQPRALFFALLYGALITLAFVIWPLGRAHDAAVAALFRDAVEPASRMPRRRYVVLTAIAVAALAALAIGAAEDRKIAIIYVVASAAVFVVLRLLAAAIMAASRRAPRPRSTTLRLALSNIYRPGALTPSVVLSLGLGLSLLVTLALIEGNLRRQLTSTLPKQAPSFFFLDITSAESKRFDAFIRDHSPADARLDEVPMLRGRIVSLKGVPVEDIKPDPEAAWVLQSDRGITFAEDVPEGSAIVGGAWWPEHYDGPPVVSFEQRIADLLKLKVGDQIVVNVLGRNVEASIANLRRVDWENLGINFVMLFPPNTFQGAPYNLLATLTYADGGKPETELKLIKELTSAFPAVTSVRVKEALDAINSIVADLAKAVRGAAAITLIASILVLAGALAAGHHTRVYDAVILKTLGATRGRLVLAYGLEYAILGLITAVIATAAGAAAGAYVVKEVMHFRFVFTPSAAGIAAGLSVFFTVVFGLIGTWRALGQKPATVLRNL
ncbi:MAG TPA: FtsX-like permease family protein [Xanthobacteraceae bacterium]|nr:FtsX-like permease family protein [Xanthobacteraceae bacterium]